MKPLFKIVIILACGIAGCTIDQDLDKYLLNESELNYSKRYRSIEEALNSPDSVYVLSIQDEAIEELPNSLNNFPYLQYLSIGNFALKKLDGDVISSLPLLQQLHIGNNNIEELPEEIGTLKHLKHINIEGNPIDDLPESFFELDSLESVTAGYTNIPLSTWKRLKTLHPAIEIGLEDGIKYDTTLTNDNFQERYEEEVMGQ